MAGDAQIATVYNEIVVSLEEGAKRGLEKAAVKWHAAIVAELSKPGTGVIYTGREGRGDHQASAPGEPPAVDLGIYRASWKFTAVQRDGDSYFVDIGTEDERGPWLELGTSSMEARPHVRPVSEHFAAERELTSDVASEVLAVESAALNAMGRQILSKLSGAL